MRTARLAAVPDVDFLCALHIVFLARRTDLLALDARRRVFEHVVAYPGLHLSEVARAVRMDVNHAKYHLQYLERHGLVSSREEGSFVVFFPRTEGELGPREVVGVDEKRVLALLRRPIILHVTLLLLDREEMTHGEILGHVDVARATLHYHLAKMEAAGLIASTKAGRERRYRLVDGPTVAATLLRYRPPDALVQGFLEAWEQLALD